MKESKITEIKTALQSAKENSGKAEWNTFLKKKKKKKKGEKKERNKNKKPHTKELHKVL